MSGRPKVHYISWIYHKVSKRVPMLLFCAALAMCISYAGIQFSLTTKAVVNNAIAGDSQAMTNSCFCWD